MYYQSYEDYMRDVLGYPRDTYNYQYNQQYNTRKTNTEVEKLYPEIYKTVYPMVCKACKQYNGQITEEFVERLTDEVYVNLETMQELRTEKPVSPISKTITKTSVTKTESRKEDETRQRRPNNNLRDLIKILIIRELLGLPQRPGRPPFPGPGPRPPFPGGGPRPPYPGGPRPPMPRNNDEINYYEELDNYYPYNNMY